MKKYYYLCRFTPTAPLRIGMGFGNATDSDVMKDSRGLPFIPGTSIAGVLRSYLSLEDARRLFGDVAQDGSGNIEESKVLVSDATMDRDASNADFRIVPRDGVGIDDETGTAKKGAKFDFEVAECKKRFTAVIELADNVSDEERFILEGVLCGILESGVSFGARTTRGYGRMEAKVSCCTLFDLDAWLAFDPFDEKQAGWTPLEKNENAKIRHIIIEADLCFEGSFTVRKYTSALPENGKNAPDYSPLSNIDCKPVIPGTSWAGSFRHHMHTLIREMTPDKETANRKQLELDNLFGVTGSGEKRKSKIRFGETVVEGAKQFTYTRNAIDRFTNAPRNQGLFTEELAWGGKGKLVIELPSDTTENHVRLLAAALNDLHLGLMTVGGEANVGRGICRIVSLNGRALDEKDEIITVKDLLEGGRAL